MLFLSISSKGCLFLWNLFHPSSFLTLSVYLEKFCISPKIKMQLPYFCIFHDAKLTDYFTQTFYFPSSEDSFLAIQPFFSPEQICV